MVKIHSSDIEPEIWGQGGTPARFGPFTVRLIHDEHAECPWQDCDGLAPVLAYTSDGLTGYGGGDDLESFFGTVSDSWICRHWRKLCEILDLDPAAHDRDARADAKEYGQTLTDTRREAFESTLQEARPGGYTGGNGPAYLDALAALYNLAGVPAIHVARNGYCQGDWARLLVVGTPDWQKECGFKKAHDIPADLERQADLWGWWAYGDVYGYSVERDGETLDSCFGYYGPYWDGDENAGGYVLAEAARALEHEAREAYGVAVNAEYAARGDFRDLRAEWRAARDFAGALAGGPICKALETQARDLVARWKAARAERLAISAILES